MAATAPTGEIWLGTIAKFTFFGVMCMCAKFGAFTTKCTIHSYLVTYTIQYNTIQYNTIQYNTIQYNTIQYNTIQYSFISAQHICSVHVMSNIVVDIYINAGLGDSY